MGTERYFAIVNGLALGEESKGNTVQALVRKLNAHTVWRSGGWQGGHHIIHDDGREMALSHFGAGVFEGADTYLKHMVISPVELFQEALDLEKLGVPNPLEKMFIDENCLATTPFHSGISRTREVLRGLNRKGTIGKGVGEAVQDSVNSELSIRAGEFSDRETILRKVENIRLAKLKTAEELLVSYEGAPPDRVYSEMSVLRDKELVSLVADAFGYAADLIKITGDDYLDELLKKDGSIVNEVSHGALHHPRYGFVPHVTQVDPTSGDVLTTLKNHNYGGNILRIGVVRSYLTRHGAGPLVSFDPELTETLVETYNNAANDWLGDFRTGYFDTVALKYSLTFAERSKAFDGLLVSYMDVLSGRNDWQVVESYKYQGYVADLDEYFDLAADKIIGIKVHPDTGDPAHYKRQFRLTQLLNECRPIVTTLTSSKGQSLEQAFLQYVTQKLEVPVVGTAYGPKVADRRFLPKWQSILNKG
ncbi:adenylosuccinate synthetase [Candidatus Daviesbacteria bacterium]|nr:adenylosuccinate synthetase [Candidatus Daviesbacteria bacterium]